MHSRADEIVEFALSLRDVAFRHQGRSATTGVDCVGLGLLTSHSLGLSDFDVRDYSRRPNVVEFKRAMMDWGCQLVPYADRAHGDLLQLSMTKWPVHCGILEVDGTGTEWLIHSLMTRRKVVREPLSGLRGAQVVCVWRMPEGA